MTMQKKLRQVLDKEDTVLFIGSGISQWSDLPTWPRLIEKLAAFVEESGYTADEVRKEAQREDLLQAASYGFDKLTPQQRGEFIRKSCLYGTAKPHPIHQKIVSLGPRYFITTNYDNLIEQSLTKWQSGRPYRIVTNRNLTEIAEIVHASAEPFVFKPHGDAGDIESIILTREQYRQLLPNGDRHAALESLKTILITRPVIYVGFGLRDPDFIYLRDILSNIYKGGTKDHYAIMADVSETEKDFWRKNYGIHLASYANASKKHDELLTYLDELIARSSTPASATCTADTILALARHAGRVTRTPKQDAEFPIQVRFYCRGNPKEEHNLSRSEFNYWPVEKFLSNGPARALLIGPPGAGKTYSINRAAACLAETLHQNCIADLFDENAITIPLVVDLKLYRGDVYKQAAESLPSGLTFDDLLQRFKVKIFLDSFNEMPIEFRESASYEADFSSFMSKIGNASIIIGSRTSDGLDKLEFLTYHLDHIERKFIDSELGRQRISYRGRFKEEILSLLQKPFYFHLVTTRAVILPSEPHPRDFYQTLFMDLRDLFEKRFGVHFNLLQALSLAAFGAIDRGEEAQPLAEVLEALKNQLQADGATTVNATDVVNWLVSRSILVPYSGARVAFFHQSVTEFLAACELSHRYQENPHTLTEKLTFTRWDQALFLTLSLLPQEAGSAFLQTIIDTDLILALNASKYLETGRDEVIAQLLYELTNRLEKSNLDITTLSKVMRIIQSNLPISEFHEPQLRALMKHDVIGGAVVRKLLELKGLSIKDELMQLMLDHCIEENNCSFYTAFALAPLATNDDVQIIADFADSIQRGEIANSDEISAERFAWAAGLFLSELDLSAVSSVLLPKDESEKIPGIRAKVLLKFIDFSGSSSAMDLAGLLLLRGVKEAAMSICWLRFVVLNWDSFSQDHVQVLLSHLDIKDDVIFSAGALFNICRARPDLARYVRELASRENEIKKAVLLYCADNNLEPVFGALTQLVGMNASERSQELTYLLSQVRIKWRGHEKLLVQLLRLKEPGSVNLLLNYYYDMGELDIGSIDWWLHWLLDENQESSRHGFHEKLGELLAYHTSNETFSQFVDEFNKKTSMFREVILEYLFCKRHDLNLGMFTEEAISYLLEVLNRVRDIKYPVSRYFLGAIATEQFVAKRLLPLLPGAKPPLLDNLRDVLRRAGSRHGRRYITE